MKNKKHVTLTLICSIDDLHIHVHWTTLTYHFLNHYNLTSYMCVDDSRTIPDDLSSYLLSGEYGRLISVSLTYTTVLSLDAFLYFLLKKIGYVSLHTCMTSSWSSQKIKFRLHFFYNYDIDIFHTNRFKHLRIWFWYKTGHNFLITYKTFCDLNHTI